MRKVVKVGIISREDYRKRTIAIAKGEYMPRKDEPKIWFESLRSMAQVLGSENQKLLRIIMENNPRSLAELEQLTGRKKANLSRTLKTLERYGVVALEREKNRLVPKVCATDFKVEFGLHYSAPMAA
jgi:predicted transcriptional regulator